MACSLKLGPGLWLRREVKQQGGLLRIRNLAYSRVCDGFGHRDPICGPHRPHALRRPPEAATAGTAGIAALHRSCARTRLRSAAAQRYLKSGRVSLWEDSRRTTSEPHGCPLPLRFDVFTCVHAARTCKLQHDSGKPQHDPGLGPLRYRFRAAGLSWAPWGFGRCTSQASLPRLALVRANMPCIGVIRSRGSAAAASRYRTRAATRRQPTMNWIAYRTTHNRGRPIDQ
jgi:hypothetical protein